MNPRRTFAPLLTTLAIGAAGLAAVAPSASAMPLAAQRPAAPVAALPAPVTAARVSTRDQCRLRILKVRVLNLQHDAKGIDQAFVLIGNSSTTTQSYQLPQTRNTLGTGEERFENAAQVMLRVEVANGAASTVVDAGVVPCDDVTRDFTFRNGDAAYKVKAVVQILP